MQNKLIPKFLHFSYFMPYASNLFPNVSYPVLADETAFALFWCQGKKYRELVPRACTTHKKIPAEFCKLKYKHCQGDPCMQFYWQEECLPFLQLICGLSSCWRWCAQYNLQEEHHLTSPLWNNDVSFRHLLFTFVNPHTNIFIPKTLTSQARNSGIFPVQIL